MKDLMGDIKLKKLQRIDCYDKFMLKILSFFKHKLEVIKCKKKNCEHFSFKRVFTFIKIEWILTEEVIKHLFYFSN